MSQSMEGAVVLVTGGAGLVGSHIVDQLIGERVGEIRVLDNLIRGSMNNLAPAMARGRIGFTQGDIRDQNAVRRAVDGCDVVFHQAAIRITMCADRPRDCIDVMVAGALNVFEAAVASKVKKVVYASSASVYGLAEAFPTDERHHPYNNRTLYGAAKLMNEGMAHSFEDMYGLNSTGLRYFNVYGPRMDTTGAYTEVLIRWMDCIDTGKRPQIFGDGKVSMDFVFVTDVARANLLAAKRATSGGVYNVASGKETSLLELWQSLQQVSGAYALSPELHPPRRVNPVPRRLADVRRAREELGFVAEVGIEEGLRQLVSWRRECVGRKEGAVAV